MKVRVSGPVEVYPVEPTSFSWNVGDSFQLTVPNGADVNSEGTFAELFVGLERGKARAEAAVAVNSEPLFFIDVPVCTDEPVLAQLDRDRN